MLMKTKGIHRVRRELADGTLRYHYYAWRGGPKFWSSEVAVASPAPQAFQDAYRQAQARRAAPVQSERNTISELIGKFKIEVMPGLKASTRESYDFSLQLIEKKFGRAEIGAFTVPAMRGDIKGWHRSFSETPRAADMRLGVLVRLLNYAKDEGLITGHCADDIDRLHKVSRADIIWTPSEIENFAAEAPFPLWLGIHFLRLSGMRRGDALRVQLSADKGSWLEWRTSKSNERTEVVIPIVRELRAVLDAAKRYREAKRVESTTILFNSLGRPWTPSGFSTSFDRRREALGIEKHVHDLRGTAATKFMEAGLTDGEIAEVMGWRTDDIAKIRSRYVSRAAIVSAAIRRLEGNG
ncbi:Phage integrase family protein [Faunimonas pinastri]|uniref:Phage integrase family protein n=1 Tax=Faunimonas pinastri TaxID=1855383 RepID=A0A1H9FA15_9HYPH|nr:tyrosine-type recombinase/integrase [Faunimonas pinastri]SEQ34158.1 Phage integrase family protein [Faunimonas pinastri]